MYIFIEIKPSLPSKKLHPKLAVKASLKKKAAKLAIRSADAKMNKVHQDDDYIYPALGKFIFQDNGTIYYLFFTFQKHQMMRTFLSRRMMRGIRKVKCQETRPSSRDQLGTLLRILPLRKDLK